MIYYKSGIPYSPNFNTLRVSLEQGINELIERGAKLYVEFDKTVTSGGTYDFPNSKNLKINKLYINDKRLMTTPFLSNSWYYSDLEEIGMNQTKSEGLKNYHLFVCDTVGYECFFLLLDAGDNSKVIDSANDYFSSPFGNQYTFASLSMNIICFNYRNQLCCHNNEFINTSAKVNSRYFRNIAYPPDQTENAMVQGTLVNLSSVYNLIYGAYTDISEKDKIYIDKLSFNISPVILTQFGGYGEADNIYISLNNKKVGFGTIVSDGVNKYVNCIAGYYLPYNEKLFLPSEYDGEVGPITEKYNDMFLLKNGICGMGYYSGSYDMHDVAILTYIDDDEVKLQNRNKIYLGAIRGNYLLTDYFNRDTFTSIGDFKDSLYWCFPYGYGVVKDNDCWNKISNLYIAISKNKEDLQYENFRRILTYNDYTYTNLAWPVYIEPIKHIYKNEEWYYIVIGLGADFNANDWGRLSQYTALNDIDDFYGTMDDYAEYLISYSKKEPVKNSAVSKIFNPNKLTLYIGDPWPSDLRQSMYFLNQNGFYFGSHVVSKNWVCQAVGGSDWVDLSKYSKVKLTVKMNYSRSDVVGCFCFFTAAVTNGYDLIGSNSNPAVLTHDLRYVEKPDNYVIYDNTKKDETEIYIDVSNCLGEERICFKQFMGWNGDVDDTTLKWPAADAYMYCEISDIEFIEK